MKWGAVFPQVEIGNDPAAIRDFAQGAEELGFDYLLTYEHILGAETASYPEQSFLYGHEDAFHEPMVLFGYLAGLTQRIEFVTGILVLPQRDVRLVAKQATQLSLLSDGRFRLGVGAGWNRAEAAALGTDFGTRGKRMDEQLDLLTRLWSEPLVDFEGTYHKVVRCGINPLPDPKPPLWVGGSADAVLKRAARHAQGWIPATLPVGREQEIVDKLKSYLQARGRDWADFGVDARIVLAKFERAQWPAEVESWKKLGATHFRCNTMGLGYTTPQEHLGALQTFLSEVG